MNGTLGIRFNECMVCVLLLGLGCGGDRTPVTSQSDQEKPFVEPADQSLSDASPMSDASTQKSDSAIDGDRQLQIQRLGQLMTGQRVDEAVAIVNQMLIADPEDYEAIYYLAQIQASQGELDSAAETLQTIPTTSQFGMAALGMSAQIALENEDYDQAQVQLERLLQMEPAAQQVRRELIKILNQRGRRHEAVALTRELCLSGDISEFELQTLILEADALYPLSDEQSGNSPRSPQIVGYGGKARYLVANAFFDEAVVMLEKHIKRGDACPSDIALCGAAIAESQQSDKFAWWLDQTDESTEAFPEYWAAIGAQLLLRGEFKGAVRALGEAILRDPTDVRSVRRMSKAFHSIGQHELAELWLLRHQHLASTLQAMPFDASGKQTSIQDSDRLIQALEKLGRRLEAIHWRAVFTVKNGAPSSALQELMVQRNQIVQAGESFPSEAELLCGIELSDFELPERLLSREPNSSSPQPDSTAPPALPPVFTSVTANVGIEHTYRVHTTDRRRAFAIHQTFGGGVAVLDFDLDGGPDLYFCQGSAAGPRFVATQSDLLYRNVSDADRLQVADVTTPASVTDNAYTLGVTSGDWNQDGFPDLVISNLGPDFLLINQGDGSFSSRCLNPDDELNRLSTSVAMGDLDGDHLPDLFQLNYLHDSKMTDRPPTDDLGRADRTVAPHTFNHALDRIWINDARGEGVSRDVGEPQIHRSTALGLIVGDLDASHPGNEVFVANDEQADHLWKYDLETKDLKESALLAGCAFGSLGFPVGSMGVAAADFDQSGTLDLHVTTFSQESSCHFLNVSGFFQDTSVRHGIDRVSSMHMGFGCQAIDPSNRGVWDLVVTNGHVEDLRHLGQAFRQPTQLLVNQNGKFVNGEVNAGTDDASGFWSSDHLGRALAKLDFNRDGRQDFVTTDLLGPSELLINETESGYHTVRLRLVGSISERDAIGAKVRITAGGRSWTQWIKSGDGYLCKNENVLHFGVGKSQKIDAIEINWPSGTSQSFNNLGVDQEYLIVESCPEAWTT